MKRQVKYRFLVDKNNEAAGIAHSGYEEDETPDENITCFIYGRLEGTYAIKAAIEKLTIKDVGEFGFDDSFRWDILKSYEASGTEDEIAPDDLMLEQRIMQREMNKKLYRKTA